MCIPFQISIKSLLFYVFSTATFFLKDSQDISYFGTFLYTVLYVFKNWLHKLIEGENLETRVSSTADSKTEHTWLVFNKYLMNLIITTLPVKKKS